MANHHHQQLPSSTINLINPFYLIVLVIWCFYLLPTCSIACSCVYSHPQEHFCSADFVVSLSIQGEPKQLLNHPNSQIGFLRYPVKVNKIFKGIDKTSVRKGYIYTGTSISSCTPKFNTNITYLMTGRLVNGKPFVTLCNFIAEWANLTIRQKKGFRRNFARACGCKVIDTGSYPFYSNENEPDNDGQGFDANRRVRSGNCHWETKWNIEFDCQGDYSVCTPVSTIPDKSSLATPLPFNENPESNDVTSAFNYNHNNPYTNHLNQYRRRNRSKLGQKCQWDQNADYLRCIKRKAALHLEREGAS